MDKKEAREILAEHLGRYRAKTYSDLLPLVEAKQVDAFEVRGPSGTEYQLEFQFFWDSKAGGDIRVVGAIDDGGWRAYCPLSESFILSPS